jgi:N-acetylneuraminic acid mutarotase
MTGSRSSHTATLLTNGLVLIAGGYANGQALYSAELYDPASGTWTNTGSMNTNRYGHTATLLPNGQVLVAGGNNSDEHTVYLSRAELYDPTSGTWTNTGSMNTNRCYHTATLLANGQVLVAGSLGHVVTLPPHGFSTSPLSSAELYDPGLGTWKYTGSMTAGRGGQSAVLLPDGTVVAAGSGGGSQASAELYHPDSGTWTNTGTMNVGRAFHTATMWPNGKVLVAGGDDANAGPLTSAEIYIP